MKAVVDNQIVKNAILSSLNKEICFRWSALLEYLGLGSVLADLPLFDQTTPLFKAAISTLYVTEEKEVVFHIYDHLFVENLSQIKALPQIQAPFLLQAIKKKKQKAQKNLVQTLSDYEAAFVEKTADTMHDLILHLAWDRMCVCMSHLFNHQSIDLKFLKNLDLLKGCLIESYQHIAEQRRTVPGFYRMLEALFFYQMREENLQKHTADEWTLLSRSFPVLKPEGELVDFHYIDDAILSEGKSQEHYLTMDSPDRVQSRLALAQYMIDKLKAEFPNWGYVLHPQKILYLEL